MQDYEYKDEGGRFLCRLHDKLRCDECHYVSDLRDENKRYREALNNIITLWIASTDATDDTWLAHEMSETARKALEQSE